MKTSWSYSSRRCLFGPVIYDLNDFLTFQLVSSWIFTLNLLGQKADWLFCPIPCMSWHINTFLPDSAFYSVTLNGHRLNLSVWLLLLRLWNSNMATLSLKHVGWLAEQVWEWEITVTKHIMCDWDCSKDLTCIDLFDLYDCLRQSLGSGPLYTCWN